MGGGADTDSASSGGGRQRLSKRDEEQHLREKVQRLEQRKKYKEAELADLNAEVQDLEHGLDARTRQVSQRTARNTALTNKPAVKIVGGEMASTIRRRQERRKNALRDKVRKLQSKLDDDVAHNKTLRKTIEELRHSRLHHMTAMKIGSSQVCPAQTEHRGGRTIAKRAAATARRARAAESGQPNQSYMGC